MEFILIDDSVFDLFTHEKLLLRSGLASSVTSFESGREALDFLNKLSSDIPETVILLDLQMPEINGFEFTGFYASVPEPVRNRIKLFMISSTVDLTDIKEARENPFIIRLLSKPLEIPVLKALLHN